MLPLSACFFTLFVISSKHASQKNGMLPCMQSIPFFLSEKSLFYAFLRVSAMPIAHAANATGAARTKMYSAA